MNISSILGFSLSSSEDHLCLVAANVRNAFTSENWYISAFKCLRFASERSQIWRTSNSPWKGVSCGAPLDLLLTARHTKFFDRRSYMIEGLKITLSLEYRVFSPLPRTLLQRWSLHPQRLVASQLSLRGRRWQHQYKFLYKWTRFTSCWCTSPRLCPFFSVDVWGSNECQTRWIAPDAWNWNPLAQRHGILDSLFHEGGQVTIWLHAKASPLKIRNLGQGGIRNWMRGRDRDVKR